MVLFFKYNQTKRYKLKTKEKKSKVYSGIRCPYSLDG